ncbi:hypothetical protein MKK63_15630 [Methylobacterium sp. J-088]|nr:hypothetical protein [Methylobacterium sp. J-088]MCJ2064133.1 hypothetical protein [Methylobacterium sp. J-088]
MNDELKCGIRLAGGLKKLFPYYARGGITISARYFSKGAQPREMANSRPV